MQYFKQPLPSIQAASNLAYRLSRPSTLSEVGTDVSQYSFGWHKHPDREEYVAVMNSNLTIPIHPIIHQALEDSQTNAIKQTFDSFFGAESQDMQDFIMENSRISVLSLVPNTWVPSTEQQLDADGWFDTV